MPKKLILAVAPVAHMEKTIPQGVVNPVTSNAIAEETLACYHAGASLVHLHVRSESGTQVGDLSVFSKTIDLIRKESDIIIQGSTGGISNLSLDKRSASVEESRVQMASLNMGSTNFGEGVYINTYADIRYWAKKMHDYQVIPELEVFDLSMIETCVAMARDGVLSYPLHFNFSLGFTGALSAKSENLCMLKQALPPGSSWSLLHEGMTDFSLLATAIGLGASGIRVGYEDGFSIQKGTFARNVELVQHAVQLIHSMGYEVASVAEAKEMLGIVKK
jgi:3-keto-5-aminohexanoate cleavage enzyme